MGTPVLNLYIQLRTSVLPSSESSLNSLFCREIGGTSFFSLYFNLCLTSVENLLSSAQCYKPWEVPTVASWLKSLCKHRQIFRLWLHILAWNNPDLTRSASLATLHSSEKDPGQDRPTYVFITVLCDTEEHINPVLLASTASLPTSPSVALPWIALRSIELKFLA